MSVTSSAAAVPKPPKTTPTRRSTELIPRSCVRFSAGYREILPAGTELERGGAIITYEQAMRFLTDWIAGDVYYRTTRPAHNLDRARGQLVLLASLQATFGG